MWRLIKTLRFEWVKPKVKFLHNKFKRMPMGRGGILRCSSWKFLDLILALELVLVMEKFDFGFEHLKTQIGVF